MGLFKLFAGQQGDVLTSILLLPILIITWVVTRKMPKIRKSKAHIHVLTTLLATILFQIVSIIVLQNPYEAVHINLGDALFIALFYGLYLLFNSSDVKEQIVLYGLCAAIGLISFFVNETWTAQVIAVVCTFVAWYFLANGIPYAKKAHWLLGAFATSKLFLLADTLTKEEHPVFSFGASMLLVTAYAIFLLIIVDHLLQIIQGTYYSSISDALTGLFNRKEFMKYVNRCVEKQHSSYIIFIDVDNFKELNDTQGHDKGDQVLKKVASILQEEVEGIGVAGRYGGEEMVALIIEPSVDMDELTENIRARIYEETVFQSIEGKEYRVSASIGFCKYQEGWNPAEFIKKADQAMYVAKKTGKNRVVEYGGPGFIELSVQVQTNAEAG
ncbi:diguanylate cyclase (GGDEF) domain-containing protein (plasmid) [Thermobacillus composti KWC4]|uniref:Diguanylate cyclase (GGDEF) domain-containing protein n=1 Tax=Thermobacillus composti (strain DSM 18247 / JCM 13945 / KWC4) TaxID=717605 RepID=L0EIF3_THECK|nr:diguanylate cyclase (GGDEF) domain-containing protein [Thermobacillus composti KWC4]